MSESSSEAAGSGGGAHAPEGPLFGEQRGLGASVLTYVYGLVLAILLTVASFWAAHTELIYGPSVPMAIAVFAVAQMGIHLVFFLHITTSPDNTNNVLALAFGLLIAGLVVFGSLWIMQHLNQNLMPMPPQAFP
jgi:cytochrome o ubiquinol oxidase subunit IV